MKALCILSLITLVAGGLLPRSAAAAPGCLAFQFPGRVVLGLAWEPGALWVTSSPKGDGDQVLISKLDPSTGRVLAQSPVLSHSGRGICLGGGSLWVTDALYDRVRELDPADFHEISSFATPGTEPSGITFDGTDLWLTDPWAQQLYHLTTAGTVVESCPIPNEFRGGLEWQGAGLWMPVGNDTAVHSLGGCGASDSTYVFPCLPSGVAMYDIAMGGTQWFASSGDRVYYTHSLECASFLFPGREICGLTWELGALWVTSMPLGDSDHVRILKLDPTTGAVLAQSADLNHNGRGICLGAGSLWVTDALYDRVRELDPADFHEISSFATPGTEPSGITFDGTDLWLTDPWAQQLYHLTTAGTVVESCPIPNEFRGGLEWQGTGLWMPVGAEAAVRYQGGCGPSDSTYVFPCLPSGAAMYDIAMGGTQWFASSREHIYYTHPDECFCFEFPGRAVCGLAWEPGALWATSMPLGDSDHARIMKLDPTTGAVLAQTEERPHNARGICLGAGSLWVVDATNDVVRELDPADLHEIRTFRTPGTEPCGIAFDGTFLWLSDPYAQKIYKLNTSGEVIGSFSIPDEYRTALEWRNYGLWTTAGLTTVVHYTPAGGIDLTENLSLDCASEDGRIFDLAIGVDRRYFSSRERICVLRGGVATDIGPEDGSAGAGAALALRLNGIGSLRRGVAIQYELPKQAQVKLAVYDVAGRLRAVLRDGIEPAGVHTMLWNGQSAQGGRLAAGVYFMKLEAGKEQRRAKIVLTR